MSSSEVNIRPAIKEDYEAITRGLEEWYWPYEPLSLGFRIKTPSPMEKHLFTSLPEEQGMTLVATIPDKNEKIVGILVSAPNHPNLFQEIAEELGGESDKRIEAMFGILSALSKKVNIFQRYNVNETFDLVALAVNPDNRGQNIGYKLFENAFLMAKNLGYKIVSVDCTSKFSANISIRLNMERIVAIEYKQYKDLEGNQIFTPPPEHTHITRFIKQL